MNSATTFNHIIIGGMQRSGTSLLRAIVGSHSEVGIYQMELPFWTEFHLIHKGKKLSQEKALIVLDEILNHFTVKQIDTKLNRDVLVADVKALGSEVVIEDIYQVFLTHYMDVRQKSFVGLKTPRNEWYADAIFSAFPDTKFLHIIRNPMDQAVSISKAKENIWGGKQNHFANIYDWETSVQAARNNEQKYRDNYLVLTYEELVTNYDEVLPRVCDFLGVNYEPEMIAGKGHPGWKGRNSTVGGEEKYGLSADSIGRYKTMLSENEQQLYKQLLGQALVDFDYLSPEELPNRGAAGLKMRYAFSKAYQSTRWKMARALKNSIFFKSIRGVKRMLGMSHDNFLESKKAKAASGRS